MKWGAALWACRVSSRRSGPARLVSTARSKGLSKATDAAEWIRMSQLAKSASVSGVAASPSAAMSHSKTLTLLAQHSAKPFAPSSSLRRSNAVLRQISRSTRRCAPARPGRTSKANSQSGTHRKRRSTRAVPKKPVEPVIAMRLPARAAAMITGCGLWVGRSGFLLLSLASILRSRCCIC